MSENTDKRNATQRIEDLEKVVVELYQVMAQNKNVLENLLRSQGYMALIKDIAKLLNKKTDAIIQLATPETGINTNSVSDLVVKMNVEEMKSQVSGWLSSGNLAPSEEIAANSYVVLEEYQKDGTLANPRIQFRLDSQDATTGAALLGKKAGETISFGENKFDAKVLEIYALVDPNAPKAEAVVPDATPTAETAAPTETVSADAAQTPSQTGPSNEALAAPTESPVTEFVPSEPGMMTTAS